MSKAQAVEPSTLTGVPSFSPKEILDLLVEAMLNNWTVAVTGPPGCGKSDLVDQAAARCKMPVITSHDCLGDITDHKGMPYKGKGHSAEFAPFGEMLQFMNLTEPAVNHIEDFSQASAQMQAGRMQMILRGEVAGKRIRKDLLRFIFTCNRASDMAAANAIIEPMKDRQYMIVEVSPSADDWCDWGSANGIHPLALAYCKLNPGVITGWKPSRGLTRTPTARSLHFASNMLHVWKNSVDVRKLAACIGYADAVQMVQLITDGEGMIPPSEIMLNPGKVPIPTEPAQKMLTCTGLVSILEMKSLTPFMIYVNRAPESMSVQMMSFAKAKFTPDEAKIKAFWAHDDVTKWFKKPEIIHITSVASEKGK